jgi:hypothetical protein
MERQIYERLDLIARDHPVTCAEYAKQNKALDMAGWKRFCSMAKSDNQIERMVHQAKFCNYQCDPFWKYCVLFPQIYAHAIGLDNKDNTAKWQKSESTEMGQLLEYEPFVEKRNRWERTNMIQNNLFSHER